MQASLHVSLSKFCRILGIPPCENMSVTLNEALYFENCEISENSKVSGDLLFACVRAFARAYNVCGGRSDAII